MRMPFIIYLFSIAASIVFVFFVIWGCVKGDESINQITGKALLMIIGYVLGTLHG